MSSGNGKNPSCLFPQCKGAALFRGLCKAHYATARKLVHDGQTDWANLEKSGKAKPKLRGAVTSWFLSEAK